jgi:hypothetical protein
MLETGLACRCPKRTQQSRRVEFIESCWEVASSNRDAEQLVYHALSAMVAIKNAFLRYLLGELVTIGVCIGLSNVPAN